jgi:hypothetical protein
LSSTMLTWTFPSSLNLESVSASTSPNSISPI